MTSGACRDLGQVEAVKFPCFTSGTICSHGYTQIVDLCSPVRGGGKLENLDQYARGCLAWMRQHVPQGTAATVQR